MPKPVPLWPVSAAFLVLSCVPVHAQEIRASLSGNVTDPTGAAITGAHIAARNTATNVVVNTTSGGDGRYALSQLPPGPYELTAEAEGFRKFTRRGITLNVGDKAGIDLRLEVGSLAESVTVTAELTGVESNQSVMGQLMDTKKVSELPLNGRSYLMLLQLSAGVVFTVQQFGPAGWSGTRQWETGPAAGQFTIHGSRPRSNAFLLDGAPQGVEGGTSYVPLVDAIEEFKVVSPTSDASQGLSGGGVVNLTMKSGTNELHGLLSHFLRNNIFDANTTQTNRAAAQRPDLKSQKHQWNNFSAMLNGPVKKDKLFFSANYDGFRQRVPFPVTNTVPTLAQRDGDFSQTYNAARQMLVIYDPLTTRQQGTSFVRQAFPGNRVPADRISTPARNILKQIPLPNIVTNPITQFNNYAASPNTGQYRYDSYYVKFDYVWNEKHRSFVSETQHWGHEYRAVNGLPRGNPGISGGDPNTRDHLAATIDHVWAINPRTVLNARLAGDRFVQGNYRRAAQNFDGSQLGFNGPIGSFPQTRFPTLTFTDYLSMANQPAIGYSPNDTYTAVADVSRTVNRHFLKWGTRISQSRYSRFTAGNWFGSFAFNKGFTQRDPQRGDAVSGNAMASFLLGYAASGNTDVNPYSSYENKAVGLYIQDDIKLTSTLTLNVGLRWDVQMAPTERFNRIVRGFDPDVTYALGNTQARGGFLFADENHRQPWSTNWRDFQPRFGVAWQTGPKLVWRAGYGLSYLPLNGIGGAGDIQQNGYSRSTPLVPTIGGGVNSFIPAQPGAGTFELPFPEGILQPQGAGLGPKTQVGQAIAFQNADYQIPRVHQFHFGFNYELPGKVTTELSYVGSRTRKFPVNKALNSISMSERLKGVADSTYLNASVPNLFAGAPELAGTGLANTTVTRSQSLLPYPQFGGVTMNGLPIGNTSYDALEVRVNKRFSGGLALTGSYTFSKTIEAVAFREPQYEKPFRVLADFDRTHHLTAFALYDLPFGRGKRIGAGWGRAFDLIAGNWQYNAVLEYMSGTPVQLPDATPVGDPRLPGGKQSFGRWFNTCTLMTSGARANCASPDEPIAWLQLKPNEPRTYTSRFPNLRNYWLPQMNMSVFKMFPIRERVRLEFRAEAFNAFNTPIYGPPNVGLTSAQFGVVTLDQNNFPRNMQFALRLKF